MVPKVSGTEAGQRQLNGPQTTGREYRNLSQPAYSMTVDEDVEATMRDGVNLLADVHRPSETGRFPVLVAASPYPRQIQNMGGACGLHRSWCK
jgi:predicted acyl esterase